MARAALGKSAERWKDGEAVSGKTSNFGPQKVGGIEK